MKRDYKVELCDIISMLNAQWDSLVTELIPNATRHSGYFTIGDIHGNPGKSCVLYRGAKAGAWVDSGGVETDKGVSIKKNEKLKSINQHNHKAEAYQRAPPFHRLLFQ